MTSVAYPDCFSGAVAELEARGPAWLGRLRRAGLARFAALGFPTTRQEEYKYTSLKPLQAATFELARAPGADVAPEQLERLELLHLGETRLVFVDGHFAPRLSTFQSLPEGALVTNLAAVLARDPDRLRPHLDRPQDDASYPFAAANLALFEDGALVDIPRGAILAEPIHLVYLSTGHGRPQASHPRSLVIIGESSQVSLVETYASLAGTASFTNAVTDLHLAQNAVVDHYRLQEEATDAFHIAKLAVHQARSSTYLSQNFSLGAALSRVDIAASLDGEGAECTLNGLFLAKGRQHVDHHTAIDHRAPHCNSWEVYKGVLDGHASGVFNGKIFVRPAAQKTDAKQSNRNLLLSPDATVNTKPQLEIWADDVRCTHGATVGQLDTEALFYLQARGLPLDEARSLLTYAFANEIVEPVSLDPLREKLAHDLSRWLPRRTIALEAPR